MSPNAIDILMDKLLREAGYGDVLDAAIEGDSDDQCYLGMIWELGKKADGGWTMPVSLGQAIRWYSIAADDAYEGLREDAIRHRDRLIELREQTECESKRSYPDAHESTGVYQIFSTFRSLGISPTSIDNSQVRVNYSNWAQNEDDKWESGSVIGRDNLPLADLDQLLQVAKNLGIRPDQITDHQTRIIYASRLNKGETMANIIADVALQDNTDERTPLVLVLDCSGSMEGERIAALNAGLVTLESAMKNDPTTSTRGRVLVIQFGDNDDVTQGDWQDAMDFAAPILEANGRTPTGAAITTALAAIEAQKIELRAAGIAYKRPILMLMSDGEPTDDWKEAADACKAAEAANKVTVFSIGIGEDANLDSLGRFSSKGAVRIKGLQFKELFVWLSASIKAVSQTKKGESAQLSPITSWASVGTS